MARLSDVNEQRYRRTVTALGLTMLLFLLLINLFGMLPMLLQFFLTFLPISPVAVEIIGQLVYAACYLLSFMLPVPFFKLLIRKNGYLYQPMYTSIRLSPLLVPIVFGGITLIWAQSYVNAGLVSVFNYAEFSAAFLWGEGGSLKGYQIVLTFIVTCMVPAFCEEFLFRGAILTNLLPFGRGNAILISSLLFGLMHQNAEQILYAFAAGIFLGLVYERTGSIWNCTFLHLINNFASTAIAVAAEKLGGRMPELMYVAIEGGIFLIGALSIVILVRASSAAKPELSNGFFGRSLPSSDAYAACPVAPRRAFRLFLSFPMVLFLVFCLLQILLLLLLSVLYGSLLV